MLETILFKWIFWQKITVIMTEHHIIFFGSNHLTSTH